MRFSPLLLAAALFGLTAPAFAATDRTKPDVALMKKAVVVLEHSQAIQSDSDIQLHGTGQGMTVTIREHVHFTRLRPNRFRADVTLFSPDGKPSALYIIVSDGKTVWTIDLYGKRYASAPLAEYRKSYNLGRHIAGLGFFGSLVVGSEDPKDDILRQLTVLLATQPDASGGTETVDGTPLHALGLVFGGYKTRFLLDPKTAAFRQLEFSGQEPQMHIALTEKITRQTLSPKLDPALYQFTPSAGLKQVPAIRIGFLP